MYCLFGEVYEVANGCSRMRRLSGYWLSNGRLGNGLVNDISDAAYDLTGYFGRFSSLVFLWRGLWLHRWLICRDGGEPVLLGYLVFNLEEITFF